MGGGSDIRLGSVQPSSAFARSRIWVCGVLTLLTCLVQGGATAATRTATLAPTITIRATCTVTSAGLNFGAVTNLAANLNVNATLTVRCTNATPYAVGLGAGLNSAAVTTRKMKYALGAQTVNYSIFRNAARTLNWGQTVGTDTVAGTGNGANQNLTARGQIPGPQIVPHTGGYNDTVQMIVTY